MAHFFLVAQTARGPVWGVANGVPEEHLHWVYREGIEPDADPESSSTIGTPWSAPRPPRTPSTCSRPGASIRPT